MNILKRCLVLDYIAIFGLVRFHCIVLAVVRLLVVY